jgi:hypothetical protein
MAGHLEVPILENARLIMRVRGFLSLHSIKEMSDFQLIVNNNTSFRKLSSEYFMDSKDKFVLSVSPWTFKVEDEIIEFANAEIHLDKDKKINKIFMVM